MNTSKLGLVAALALTMVTSSAFAEPFFADHVKKTETVYGPAATGGGSTGYNQSQANPDR